MKNKEKFAKEIVEIACDGDDIAIDKRTGKVSSCTHVPCSNCLFCKNGCAKGRRKWAESEYIEKPVISKRDREFLGHIREEYKFVARDENGKLFIYETQPKKGKTYWYLTYDMYSCLNRYYNVDFPMVKWEDSEPWLIEDLKKLEVVEDYE
jgi:hypothetical protein